MCCLVATSRLPMAVVCGDAPLRLTALSSALLLCRPWVPAYLPGCSLAAHYEDLMNAETQGKSGKKGQWSNKEPPRPHVNDVSLPGNATRWAAAGVVRLAGSVGGIQTTFPAVLPAIELLPPIACC